MPRSVIFRQLFVVATIAALVSARDASERPYDGNETTEEVPNVTYEVTTHFKEYATVLGENLNDVPIPKSENSTNQNLKINYTSTDIGLTGSVAQYNVSFGDIPHSEEYLLDVENVTKKVNLNRSNTERYEVVTSPVINNYKFENDKKTMVDNKQHTGSSKVQDNRAKEKLKSIMIINTTSKAPPNDDKMKHIHELSKMFGLEGQVKNIPKDYLNILGSMTPEERLATTLAFKKRYNVEPHFEKIFNITSSQHNENPENYGISIVLSSDIMALTALVETMEDSLCKNQSLRLLRGLLAGKLWALKMYDASAKSPTGLLWGNTFQLGNFDECLQARSYEDEETTVQGQYCLANVELIKRTLPTTHYGKRTGPREDIHWAVCVPATCSSTQIQQFVSSLLISSSGGGKVTLPANYCHKQEPLKLEQKDIIFGSFIVGFSVILIACTMFHLYMHLKHKNSPKRPTGILESAILSFSVARNLRKIFSVKKSEYGLDAIAGIRTLAMFLILSGHALIFIFSGPIMNSGFYDEMLTRVENTLLLSNPLLVDTFLLISAFLFCRLLLLEFDKRKGNVNVIPIYLFRYLRVTPSYFVVIALYMTWLDKMDSGPLWDSKMELEKERCLQSWWTNILYVNNYVNTDHLCMFQSWYLSVDTQLFFLAPILIYPLWKWPRVGEWLLGAVTFVATLIPFVVTYWWKLDPTLLPYPKEVVDISSNYYFKEVYIKTHMRASAYCVGLISGYILHKIQTNGYKLKTKTLVLGWIMAIICGVSSVFTVSVFYQPDYVYNPFSAAMYSALHRIAWAASTGWLLIVCATKNGGPLGKIFLWKPLIPLGRLTFCAYLVNGLVELHSLGTLRDSIHLSIYDLTILCFSHILQTFVGALVLCVMFESPIHGFERILLKAIGNNKRDSTETKRDLESPHK